MTVYNIKQYFSTPLKIEKLSFLSDTNAVTSSNLSSGSYSSLKPRNPSIEEAGSISRTTE